MLKRLANLRGKQHKLKEQGKTHAGFFWTTVAEDKQRLFTEKVNRTVSECMNFRCPRGKILIRLNILIKNI